MKPIFLVGFMGSGKTTYGRRIAKYLIREFIDLDKAIENDEGVYIKDIFQAAGEEYFRKREAEVLRRVCRENAVIACGGGTPCFHENMNFMRETGTVVYLKTEEHVLVSRLERNKSQRPLVMMMDHKELKEYVRTKIREREPYYLQASLIFESEKTSVKDLLDQLR